MVCATFSRRLSPLFLTLSSQSHATKLTTMSKNNTGGMMEEQWKLWPYFNESIKWHSDWIRWDPYSLSVKEQIRAYRDFTAHDGHYSMHRNTYFYEDSRGTVSEGPLSGPWKIDKNDPEASDPYGAIHVSRPYMRTLMCPDRSGAWLMKELPHGVNRSPAGFELFLGDGMNLRLSVGVVYDAEGKLSGISAIREDSRDFGLFWTSREELPALKKYVDRADQATVLKDFWPPTSNSLDITSFQVMLPGPIQSTTKGIDRADLNSLKSNPENIDEDDVIFEMPDGIFVVCSSQLHGSDLEPNVSTNNNTKSGDFVVAAGWKKEDGQSWTSFIEARYKNFVMDELVYTKFTSEQNK